MTLTRRSRPMLLWASVLCLSTAPLSADTYPRQPGIDAVHYRFSLTLRDDADRIEGRAEVTVRFLEPGLEAVALDLASARDGRGMTVSSVRWGTARVPFAHDADRLRLPVTPTAAAGEERTFTVEYAGVPAQGLVIGPNKHGERTFFGLNWPDLARQWLPTIDHPSEKATAEFLVTAPALYQVVSNGLLVEETDLAGGQRRTHWKQAVPISPWLFTLGVARFAVHHAGEVAGVPLQTWVFPADRDAGIRDFEGPSREIMTFFSERIGPYPYEKLANVQAAGLRGGTEKASAIMYGQDAPTGAGAITGLVAHEIAHQWFGNSVTERDWNDVWLSEGFATYCTLLFVEHSQGRDAFVAGLERSRAAVFEMERELPDAPVIHRNLADMKRVLNRLIYQKGGWTLHMLRALVGTDRFWEGLRAYYRRYRDRTAATDDFRREMERVSGVDLSAFFAQWLTRARSPAVRGGWRYDAAAKRVEIDLEQTQPGDAYRLSMEIGVTLPGSAPRIERVDITGRTQRITFEAGVEPAAVVLDPNTVMLMQAEFVKRPAPPAGRRRPR